MHKAFSLSLAVALTLTGCGVVRRSPTWATVRSVRVDTRDQVDPSAAYAQQLSATLKSANVQHKVVTYQYRYRTILREEAITTRTAVIYRDDSNPNNPWWLMDDRQKRPVWLPGEDENRQVAFYLTRPATVIESTTVPGDSEPKQMMADPGAHQETPMLARHEPVRKTERSRRFDAPIGAKAFAKRETRNPFVRLAHVLSPKPREAFLPAPTGPVPEPPQSARFVSLFQAQHGTAFDPASVTDQRKMEQLLLARR